MKVEINESKVAALYDALVAAGIVEDLKTAGETFDKADRQFSKLAGKFWKAGFRAEHLSGETKVPEYYAAVKRAVIESWPANHQRLLAIKGHDVAELSDAEQGLRAKRQRDIGAYIGLIARHLRKLGDPKARGTKKAEAEQKVIEAADPVVILQGMIAKKTTLVDVANVDRFENAALEMIALIRAHRKA